MNFLQQALRLAKCAKALGEVPVGACIADQLGNPIAEGYNQVIQNSDPSAHAEIIALRRAGLSQSNYRLTGMTLYVTLEPCWMCFAACVHARLSRIVYLAPDLQRGAIGLHIHESAHWNHRIQCDLAVVDLGYAEYLRSFFRDKR